MRKKKVKAKARRRTFPKAIRELAKDPIFTRIAPRQPDFTPAPHPYAPAPERRQGHSALRVRDGRLEVFDPNPGTDDSTPETDAFTRDHARTAAEWFQFSRGLERRLRTAQREYKKGWDAFYRLRRSIAQRDYPALTGVVRPA